MGERLKAARQRRIDGIEAECRSIEKRIGLLFDERLEKAHAKYRSLRRELGYLLLARDRASRPHIYSRAAYEEKRDGR